MRTNLTVVPGRCAAASQEPMNTPGADYGAIVEHVWKRTMFMDSGFSADALPRNDAGAPEAVS